MTRAITWAMTAAVCLWPMAAEAEQVGAQAGTQAALYETGVTPSGTRLRVWRIGRTGAELEVRGAGLTLRRVVDSGRATTEIVAAGSHLRIETSRERVRVVDADGVWEAEAGDREGAAAVRGHVVQSAAFATALDLLRRLARESSGPVAHLVLSTRNALAALRGERRVLPPPAPPAEQPRLGRPRLITAALGQMTPGECWDIYAADAIEIYMEYEDCVDNEEWWDIIGLGSCATIYELQAVGAFSWWLNCTALRG